MKQSTELTKLITRLKNKNVAKLVALKPAGTKLILDSSSSELIDLLRITILDLVLKQVLIIKKEVKKLHPNESHAREFIIVETGKNFTKYKPDVFERYFTDIIDEETYFHLKVYLRKIYKDIPSEYRFKKQIVRDLKINDNFKNGIFNNIVGTLRNNKKGTILKSQLKKYLNSVDENIVNLIESKPEQALQLVIYLQGNIFLLENLKFELWEKLKLGNKITNSEYTLDDNLYWSEFIFDSDFSFDDMFADISWVFDSIDDYFSAYSDSDYDDYGDYDGDW